MYTVEKAKRLMYRAYHHDDAMLLQFFLSEFITTHDAITQLNADFKEFSLSLDKRTTKKSRQKLLESLIVTTRKLTGANYDSMPHLYWNYDQGLLHKLNNYAALFSRTSPAEDGKPLRIYRYIGQSLLNGIHLHNLLLSLQNVPTTQWKEYLEEISRHCNRLNHDLRRAIKILPTIVKEYSNDENVLFFILRHSDELEPLLFPGSVRQLLEKMYPQGLSEVKKHLTRKYRSRGFSQLLPIISAKIDNLKKCL